MHDHWLIALALATATLGMAGLLVAAVFLEQPLSSFMSVQGAPDGEPVRIKGEVVQIREGNITAITITQPSTLTVTAFENLSVHPGDCIIVSGKRSTYKGVAQVSASKIVRCS